MDQEREDYVDHPTRARQPWTLGQITLFFLIVLLFLPLAFVALISPVIILSGGMRY